MIENTLWIIVALLVLIAWELHKISSRLKDRFPTEKEEDYRWSQEDPQGHWEAHKDEMKSGKKKS
jgi:hypothetical protein